MVLWKRSLQRLQKVQSLYEILKVAYYLGPPYFTKLISHHLVPSCALIGWLFKQDGQLTPVFLDSFFFFFLVVSPEFSAQQQAQLVIPLLSFVETFLVLSLGLLHFLKNSLCLIGIPSYLQVSCALIFPEPSFLTRVSQNSHCSCHLLSPKSALS